MAKAKRSVASQIGFWAFILGLVIAIAFGFMAALGMGAAFMPWVIIILIILGLVVGFLNITAKEILLFLVATIALIVVGGVFAPLNVFAIGNILDAILALVATLMAPAAIVAAIKALWAVGMPG
ncbi:hypothetical protein ACFLTN_07390 [Chloroflexota bacterium]